MIRLSHIERFYELLNSCTELSGGLKRLSECSGYSAWPKRGVYFFFESGEARKGGGRRRVVRVGTHALKAGSGTTLWNRLSQHRGAKSSGRGNHRGSIFRLLVGAALIEREGLSCPTWGVGSSAKGEIRMAERELEAKVSGVVGAMELTWLPVPDEPGPESSRGLIERNSIALLSNLDRSPIDPASDGWLGRWCPRERVVGSGMWNQNHVNEDYDPSFLDQFAALVRNAQARQ